MLIASRSARSDVFTELIKANIPSRAVFSAASEDDSRAVLDMTGAEKLHYFGELLYKDMECREPKRIRGGLASSAEILRVVMYLKNNTEGVYYGEAVGETEKWQSEHERQNKGAASAEEAGLNDKHRDMVEEAAWIVVENQRAATALLQRKLKIGYTQALCLLNELEKMGVVGISEGDEPREVLLTPEQWQEREAAGTRSAEDK